MRKAVPFCTAVVTLSFLATEAKAQESTGQSSAGQGWTVITGETVGAGNTVVHAQAGWPGISATLLHGYNPTIDIGGIFTFNYGYEGDVNEVHPGLKLQALGKLNFLDTPKYNLGAYFAPGFLVYFFSDPVGTLAGITFPVGLMFGVPVTSAVNVAFNFDLPMFVTFGTYGQFTIPILFGGGVEYFLDRNMALTFNLRMGPIIYTKGGGSDFDLQALIGLAFKL
jgi:hypothetical protein